MGVSEDLIERLRSGGGRKLERPTSRQASAPMRFTDSPVDQAGINSPFTGYGVETAMCSRPSAVLDNFSRHSVQQPVFRDYIPFPSHPTPPQSSSPPSRPQMNFYIPHQDHSPRAPTTFADFAARIGQGPATPVQPSSDFDRADRRPVFMSNGYGIETYPRMGSGAEFQIPSPPFEATPHVNHSVLQQAPPQLLTEAAVQNRQPQEPEDEYAEDDRWFESAMAEVDLEIIQSTSAQGQQPRIAPMEAARPAPERVITRSPYFPAPSPSEAFNVPQSSQMRSSSRLSNTSSSVTFPKRPGSGLLMRSSAVTPPILTPTPRKAIGVRQHNAPEGVQRSPDTSDLIAVSQLDSAEETRLFNFQHFNKMQSAVFDAAYRSDENLVVSAPTGSGKTTVFELAFLRMRSTPCSDRPLAIYMAPTKALCAERANDWSSKLTAIDATCLEFTGDTDFSALFNRVRSVDLIVTTPEKWDAVTRRSSMNRILSRLHLMMIDEVHTLNEAPRGATLEVVVARMKSRGDGVRFVAVSATAPNIDDIARWIGNTIVPPSAEQSNSNPVASMPKARVFKFGEEMRPVPLKKVTLGFECGSGNKFALDARLDKELYPVLVRYGERRPILVFCATRKACQATAAKMAQQYEDALGSGRSLPWDQAKNERLDLKDDSIQALTKFGIAVHHAGIDLSDRREIEQAFKSSKLHLLVATSTLAVGVNLPAHLVVIKGTFMWNGQGFREYSDIEIQQMMGRAGRPQFDTSGTVVVMCERSQVSRYQQMLESRMLLESCLHENLTEHLNSEIGLKTITSIREAQDWLKRSFLYIRIQQNPRHYMNKLVKDQQRTWDETLEAYAEKALGDLESQDLVSNDEADDGFDGQSQRSILSLTSMGKIMAHNFICYDTMCNIMAMEPNADLRSLLEILAGSEEFSTIRIRQGEKGMLNKLRTSEDIRFRLAEPVKTYADKVFLHLQVIFGNVSLDKYAAKTENGLPMQTQLAIYNSAPRIAKAILLVATEKGYGGASRAALELLRTVNGMAWEDSATIFRQIDQVGPKSISVLEANGITSWDKLLALDASRLEVWLNRQSPFGFEVLRQAKQMPRFYLTMGLDDGEERDNPEPAVSKDEKGWPVLRLRVTVVCKGIYNSAAAKSKTKSSASERGRKRKKLRTKDSYQFSILFVTSDNNRFVDLRRIDTEDLTDDDNDMIVNVKLCSPTETIIAIAGIEEKAGLTTTFEYKPRIPRRMFPSEEELRRPNVENIENIEEEEVAPIPEPDDRQQHRRCSMDDDHASPAGTPPPPKRRRRSPRISQSEEEVDELDSSSSGEELIDLTARKKRKAKSKTLPGGGKPKRPKSSLSAAARKAILDTSESIEQPVRLGPTWATASGGGDDKGSAFLTTQATSSKARSVPSAAKRPRLSDS